MRIMSSIISAAIVAASLAMANVPSAHAQDLNNGVSCSVQAYLMEEIASGPTTKLRIKHVVTCNQVVEKLVVYGTDFKEGFESTSKVHTTETCYNDSSCAIMDLEVPVQSGDSIRGWYITRTSADVGTNANQRAYGSVTEVRQRQWWQYGS